MSEVSAGMAALLARFAGMSASVVARSLLLDLCGSRRFNDTHESMFARAGKAASISPRRVRAIINREKHVRVSGDELLAIQRAAAALEAHADLARNAAALADSAALQAEHERLRRRAEDLGRQLTAAADASLRLAGR